MKKSSNKSSENYLFLFSRDYPALALAECQSLHPEVRSWLHNDSYALAEINNVHCEHLAYTKKVFKVFKEGTFEEIRGFVSSHPLEKVDESVSFQKVCLDDKCEEETIPSPEARRLLNEFTQRPTINLSNPVRTFVLLCEKDRFRIAEEIWENKEKFSKRRNHLLPAPHPTSMQPKLARALINLANPTIGDHILDPFCGSGGILIESRLMNFKTSGIDIDSHMIQRAKKNLSRFNLEAELYEGDARKKLLPAQCIITDLPYGKNSKADNLEEVYADFLKIAKEYTKKMVLAYPHMVDVKKIINNSSWRIEKEFSLPLHKSLSKEILVLTCS